MKMDVNNTQINTTASVIIAIIGDAEKPAFMVSFLDFTCLICLFFKILLNVKNIFFIFLTWDGNPGQSFRMDLPYSALFILKDPNLTFHLKDPNIF